MNRTEGSSNPMNDLWNMADDVWDVTEDLRSRGLIWAAHENCPSKDDEEVKENTERGDSNDDRCNSLVNLPKVSREGAAQ